MRAWKKVKWYFTGDIVECACCGGETRLMRGLWQQYGTKQRRITWSSRCPMWGEILRRRDQIGTDDPKS